MSKQKASKDLRITIQGEFYGEAVFGIARHVFPRDSDRREKAELIWRLEIQTRQRLLEYCVANNIKVPGELWDTFKGRVKGLFLPLLPWRWVMKIALMEIDNHLPVLFRLEALASDEDWPLFRYLVQHELAIRHFVLMELARRPSTSLSEVSALLPS